MNLDAVVVDIDERGEVRGAARPLITGYHEDFPPAWSPDGRWMAYHSHRSATPIPCYNAPGTTDDICLRRADDPKAEEIRLTDFGLEVGTPSWSADGRPLFFSSLDRAAPGVTVPWVLTIDPKTGRRERVEKWEVPGPIRNFKGFRWAPTGEEARRSRGRDLPRTRASYGSRAPIARTLTASRPSGRRPTAGSPGRRTPACWSFPRSQTIGCSCSP
jgi:hypothetical protein